MKRFLPSLLLAAGCAAALASDIPPPRKISDAEHRRLYERFARRGQVDLYVASTAALKLQPDDERLWTPAARLGDKAVALSKMTGDRAPFRGPLTERGFDSLRKRYRSAFVRTDDWYARPQKNAKGVELASYPVAVNAAGVRADWGLDGLAVSRGPVSAKKFTVGSLVLANGDVTTDDCTHSVICDGDVRVKGALDSLVIARGNIDVKVARGCVLVACGIAKAEKVPNVGFPPVPKDPAALTRWKAEVEDAERIMVIVRDKEPKPLGFVTFFEWSAVGLEVKAAEKVVGVTKVTARSAAEKAGLEAGDLILEVGGKRPTDAESLRRLLRDALAVGDAAVKLRRGDQTLTVKMSLPE
jgi:hypothetical protein